MNQIHEIGREELLTRLTRAEGLRLVFALAPLPHRSKRIPRSLTFDSIDEALCALGHHDEIVVYCADVYSAASIRAYRRFEQEGYTCVRRYAGGIADWEAAGYPVEEPAAGRQPALLLAA